MCMRLSALLVLCLLSLVGSGIAGESRQVRVGVAKIDITPDYPTRLDPKAEEILINQVHRLLDTQFGTSRGTE